MEEHPSEGLGEDQASRDYEAPRVDDVDTNGEPVTTASGTVSAS